MQNRGIEIGVRNGPISELEFDHDLRIDFSKPAPQDVVGASLFQNGSVILAAKDLHS